MDFFDVIQKRFSVRSYKNDPVEQEKLNKILEAAQEAPTACNLQPFKIIVNHFTAIKCAISGDPLQHSTASCINHGLHECPHDRRCLSLRYVYTLSR